jgi:hypothetical protein
MKTPENEGSIDDLCHHLDPLQMECIIHFLRKNAREAGDESGSYGRLEQAIYKNFLKACGPEDTRRNQNDTEQ